MPFKLTESVGRVDLLTGGIPCFIAGTKVLTNTGYKLIENITLENKLLTHTGKFQSIINLQNKKYTGKLFNFKIKYLPEFVSCTEEHPFYIREQTITIENKTSIYKYGEPKWKNANEITKNDYFGMVINNNSIIPEFTFIQEINQNTNENINIKLDKKEQWFTMGYFIGDGWIMNTKKKNSSLKYDIRFTINIKD